MNEKGGAIGRLPLGCELVARVEPAEPNSSAGSTRIRHLTLPMK